MIIITDDNVLAGKLQQAAVFKNPNSGVPQNKLEPESDTQETFFGEAGTLF